MKRILAIIMIIVGLFPTVLKSQELSKAGMDKDTDHRIGVLNWIEQLRSAYIQKDLVLIEHVLADDVVIMDMAAKSPMAKTDAPLTSYDKQQYLSRMEKFFQENEFVNVKYEEIAIWQHSTRTNHYAVTMKQEWSTKDYHDEIYTYEIWDLSDETLPKILLQDWRSNQEAFNRIIEDGKALEDLDRRMWILNWIEQLKSAYTQKDIEFIKNAIGDGILITDNESKFITDNPMNCRDIQQYLSNLERVFLKSEQVYVKFSDISIKRHAIHPNYYGVTMKQEWSIKYYHDEMYIFELWDFSDESYPKILVQQWQYNKENLSDLRSFPLPSDK